MLEKERTVMMENAVRVTVSEMKVTAMETAGIWAQVMVA